MPRRCAIGCKPSRGVLHVFPNPNKFPEQFKAWVRVIGGQDECHIDYKKLRICDRHFTERDRNRNNRLNALAVPSLFLQEHLAVQTPSEPSVSTGFMTFNLLEESGNVQSSSEHVAVQTPSELSVSTSVMTLNLLEKSGNIQSLSEHLAVQTPSEPSASTSFMSFNLLEESGNVQSSSEQIAVQTPSEPSVSTSFMTLNLTEKSGNVQSLSENLVPKPRASSISNPAMNQLHTFNIEESFSDVSPKVSQDPLLEHNYCKPSRKTGTVRNWKKNLPSGVTSKKHVVYQRNIKNLRRQVYRLRKRGNDIKSRLENAENLFQKSDFQKLIKNMTPAARVFTNMQYYQAKKKSTGRRFKLEEKVLSISLYKRSPKCYGLMSKYFVLPSTKSLKRLLAQIKLNAGISKIIFEKLKKTVSNLSTEDRLCTLIFDEMSIMPQVHYDSSKDELKGFSSHGKNEIANHALVFMVKGIKKHYKQPVAYYFTNALNKCELKTIIKEVIRNVQETGLIVLCTVCDQSTVNVSAIDALVHDTKTIYLRKGKEMPHDFFEINKKRIIPLYDVPHLLKGLRNNLLTKTMNYIDYDDENKKKSVKWEYLQQLYAADKSFGELRCLQKLTEEHIIPEKIKKMRVKNAAQIFSHSVAVATEHLTARGILPKQCQDLIPITLLIDNLFDSLNCISFKHPNGKMYKAPIKRNSPHHQLWQKAKKYLKSIKFESTVKIGNKIRKIETVVPSVKNFVKTIEGIQELWKILSQKYSFDAMLTRNFNQDPVENFFGNIRNCGARNTAPNALAFEGAFKSLLLNNFNAPHSTQANCEEDTNSFLQTLEFFVKENDTVTPEIDVSEGNQILIRGEILNDERIQNDLGQRNYVCGWVLRKCLKNIIKSCKTCRKTVLISENIENNSYIKAKEYFQNKKWLVYPSEELVECFHSIQSICVSHLRKDVLKTGLKKEIKMLTEIFVNFPFKCETHQEKLKQYFTDVTINVLIYSWCRSINRILAGKLTYEGDDGDEMKMYAPNYYNKHRHNKVNK